MTKSSNGGRILRVGEAEEDKELNFQLNSHKWRM